MIGAVPLLIYAALCLACFGVPSSWTQYYFANGDSDAFAYIWFLNWWPYALTHHLNPVITSFMWSPGGYNLGWAASVPFAAFLTAPLTLTAGPVLSFNIISMTSPVLSAWSAFLLARHLTKDWPAALLAGYLFGFSSYELGHMIAHLNLETIWLIPIILLLCARRLEGSLTRRGFIILTLLALLCQLGLSLEILASAALFLAATWLVLLAISEPARRRPLLVTGLEWLAALALMIVAAAPFFFDLFIGAADLPAQLNDPAVFSTDPLNFIVPTAITRLGSDMFSGIAAHFTGALPGQGAYLGIPLILIIALGLYEARATRTGRVLMAMTGLTSVCSLGPVLHFGSALPRIALPWALVTHLPLLKSLLPNRFSMYVALCAALISARWLSAARGPVRLIRFASAIVAAFILWPNAAVFTWTQVPYAGFFAPRNIAHEIGPGRNVIILPFGANGPGALWQVQSGMAFTQSGGYLGYVPHHEALSQVADDLVNGNADVDLAGSLPAYCARHDVDDILIGPDAEPPLVSAVMAQHWPQRFENGFTIVQVPAPH
jgi:hypothetical protein